MWYAMIAIRKLYYYFQAVITETIEMIRNNFNDQILLKVEIYFFLECQICYPIHYDADNTRTDSGRTSSVSLVLASHEDGVSTPRKLQSDLCWLAIGWETQTLDLKHGS